MDWADTTARWYEKHLTFLIWWPYTRGLRVYQGDWGDGLWWYSRSKYLIPDGMVGLLVFIVVVNPHRIRWNCLLVLLLHLSWAPQPLVQVKCYIYPITLNKINPQSIRSFILQSEVLVLKVLRLWATVFMKLLWNKVQYCGYWWFGNFD